MSWRDRIARVLRLGGRAQPDNLKPWAADDIDPIEELARIINEAQERDAQDEGRFDDVAARAEATAETRAMILSEICPPSSASICAQFVDGFVDRLEESIVSY